MAANKRLTPLISAYQRGKRGEKLLWELGMCPMEGAERNNELLMDMLLDAVAESGLSVAQVLDQESQRDILRWLPQEYAGRVPSYRQFLRMLDKMGHAGLVWQNRLGRYEEELLFQAHVGRANEIVNSADRELHKSEFSMRLRMTGVLSKRRKEKGEADLVVDHAEQKSVMSSLTNEELRAFRAKLIEAKVEVVEDD